MIAPVGWLAPPQQAETLHRPQALSFRLADPEPAGPIAGLARRTREAQRPPRAAFRQLDRAPAVARRERWWLRYSASGAHQNPVLRNRFDLAAAGSDRRSVSEAQSPGSCRP